MTNILEMKPDQQVSVRDLFGIDLDLMVPAFSERDAHVPEVDSAYRFNADVTLAILAGFMKDRRVMVLTAVGGFQVISNARYLNTTKAVAVFQLCGLCADSG